MKNIIVNKNKLYFIHGMFVMLDHDVANFYGIKVKQLNQIRMRNEIEITGAFQLSEQDYSDFLQQNNLIAKKGHRPWFYTEKDSWKIAFFLRSSSAIKVADLILEIFLSVKDGKYLPSKNNDQRIAILEYQMEQVQNQMQGNLIQNNFHAPVTMLQGQNNSISMGVKEDVLLKIIDIMKQSEIVSNQELMTLLSKSIEQANKKDKKGLLENLKNIIDIGSGISTISTQIPSLIQLVEKFL